MAGGCIRLLRAGRAAAHRSDAKSHWGGFLMRQSRLNDTLRLVALAGLGVLLLLASPGFVLAEPTSGTAEIKRVIGRVEILQKGQTQWVPAVIGAKLAEGDDIRAFSGASAEIALPDTSTVVLTEN